MATEKQIAANRLNAQKSTGPRTPEGRAAVRLNGVTHGLTAETVVLKFENEADFTSLRESFTAEHQPATPTEDVLVAQLTMAAWRLRRLHNMEASYYKFRMNEQAGYATSQKLDDLGRLGFLADCETAIKTITALGRQEARLERSFYNALRELRRLRAQREKNMQNQTQFAPAPSETNEIQQSPGREAIPTETGTCSGSGYCGHDVGESESVARSVDLAVPPQDVRSSGTINRVISEVGPPDGRLV